MRMNMRGFAKNKKLIVGYTLEFLLLATVILCSFRNFSLIKGDDGMNQFYPAFVYCGKYIREVIKGLLQGQFCIPQFDFSIGLGESVIQTINYYGFGDPFMLISALTPVKYGIYGYTAAILLKMYVSGFCFMYYCRKREMAEEGILTALPFYVASNFVFYFCFQCPTYLSVLITLPLVCAGLDELIHEEKSKRKISIVLILGVAFQTLFGFYMLYIELLFAAVYALVSLLCVTKKVKKFFAQVGILFGHIMAGLMTGGILFIPTIVGFLSSSRSGDLGGHGLDVLFPMTLEKYWKALSAVVIPKGFSSNGLLLPILIVFAVVCGMKMASGYKEIKILSVIFLLAYVETIFTSYIAGGFSIDIWDNRWIFTLIFLLAVLAGAGTPYLQQMKAKGWLLAGSGALVYFVVVFALEQLVFAGSMEGARKKAFLVYSVFTVVITAVMVALENKTLIKGTRNWKKYVMSVIVVVLVGLNVYTVFEVTDIYGYGGKWNFKLYDSVTNELQASNAQLYSTEGQEFARMDIDGNAENEALYMGYNGVQEYFSIINGNIHDFYTQFMITKGLNAEKHHLQGLDSRSSLEDLLAVAYYDDVKKDVIVENDNYLPLGFTFDTYLTEEEVEDMFALTKNARSLDTVILEKEVEGVDKAENVEESTLWTEENCSVEFSNIERDGNRIKVNTESKIFVTVDSKVGGEAYIYAEQLKMYRADVRENYIYFGDSRSR